LSFVLNLPLKAKGIDEKDIAIDKTMIATKNFADEAPEGDSYQPAAALCNAGQSDRFPSS
jgi:hypothetical protein